MRERCLFCDLLRQELRQGARLALPSAPNTITSLSRIGYWESIKEDFHWHIELVPLAAQKSRPYVSREFYFTSVAPETAAARLRELPLAAGEPR